MSVAERMRTGMSVSTKRRIAERRVRIRRATSFARPLPAFMIIGTGRGGTSSLYKYLEPHPDLAASIRKETEYFSRRFGEGEPWYRAHFPIGGRRLGFEATSDYLFYPDTPQRIAERLPDARFVVLLRDPVERAWSHYRHSVRLGFEDLPFEEALDREEDRMASDLAALDRDPLFFCRELLRFSYVARGRYADQLRRWFARFDPSKFLILRSEDLRVDPGTAVDQITAFLGVRRWRPSAFPNYSLRARRSTPSASPDFSPPPTGRADRELSPAAIDRLARMFDPQVTDLELLLSRSMGWELGRTTTK